MIDYFIAHKNVKSEARIHCWEIASEICWMIYGLSYLFIIEMGNGLNKGWSVVQVCDQRLVFI